MIFPDPVWYNYLPNGYDRSTNSAYFIKGNHKTRKQELYFVDLKNKVLEKLFESSDLNQPALNPSRTRLALSENDKLVIYDLIERKRLEIDDVDFRGSGALAWGNDDLLALHQTGPSKLIEFSVSENRLVNEAVVYGSLWAMDWNKLCACFEYSISEDDKGTLRWSSDDGSYYRIDGNELRKTEKKFKGISPDSQYRYVSVSESEAGNILALFRRENESWEKIGEYQVPSPIHEREKQWFVWGASALRQAQLSALVDLSNGVVIYGEKYFAKDDFERREARKPRIKDLASDLSSGLMLMLDPEKNELLVEDINSDPPGKIIETYSVFWE